MLEKKYVRYLKKILKISSQSANIAGINELFNYYRTLTKDDIVWSIQKGKDDYPLFIGKFSNNKKKKNNILLSLHLDTVYSACDLQVRQWKNKLFGSGAYDMNASLISVLLLINQIKKNNLEIGFDIVLSSDEEAGALNKCKTNLIKLGRQYDYIFVLESSLDKEPKLYKEKRTIVGSRAGTVIFKIEINGPGGHAGVLNKKNERQSVVSLLPEIINYLENFSDYKKGTTFNIGRISGGTALNVLMPKIILSGECRVSLQEELLRVKSFILDDIPIKFSKSKFSTKAQIIDVFPIMALSQKSKQFFLKLKDKVQDKFNLHLELEHRSGGSEANFFALENTNAIILDGFGPVGEYQHTLREFVYIDSIEDSANILLEAIQLTKTC